ncbi:MAG: leucyl aminopeptidase [Chloroflexi bacterium]|nr:leucyl aminopeptidase [Chloroflexota bacterium]
MNITVTLGNIADQSASAIVVNLFEGLQNPAGATRAMDAKLGSAIRALIVSGDFKGKLGETAVLYPHENALTTRVIIVGLGKSGEFSVDHARQAAGAAAAKAVALGCRTIATVVHGAGGGGLEAKAAARAVAEGVELGAYQFAEYKSKAELALLESATLVEMDEAKIADMEAGARQGQAVGECANFARDLVNQPPNVCTPSYLAAKAEQLAAAFGLKSRTIDLAEMRELGMGALLGVAQGSSEPPKFIVLEYWPGSTAITHLAPVILVGKGVTFDTGGYSIKTAADMPEMKSDMGGAAAVLGAVRAAAMLNLPTPVVGLVPASENMISGGSYRPADVLTALNGKTIEVTNTDAEGRLLLADALAYARRYAPEAVIDMATLTGAAMIALGRGGAAALFTEHESLSQRILAAGAASGERVWPLPLYPDYLEWMKSDVADIKNSAGDRYAGTGASAAFLKEFADGYPWAHLDIAPMAFAAKGQPAKPYGPAGATGFGVRLMAALLENWQGD